MEYSFVFGMHVGSAVEVEAMLREEAEKAVAQYPQYAGHFAGYKLGRLKKNVKTKCGQVGEKGELVLFKVEATPVEVMELAKKMGREESPERAVFWSRVSKCDTMVKVSEVVGA